MLSSILYHASGTPGDRYRLVDKTSAATIALINAEHETALITWKQQKQQGLQLPGVIVYDRTPHKETEPYICRPIHLRKIVDTIKAVTGG